MTVKIKKSSLMCSPEEFAGHVEAFRGVMREYQAHLEGVRADAENEDLKPEDRRVAFPAPYADPLIMQAAAEGYEIEGPSLAEKKAALFAEVRRMESEALQAIIPPAKARHWAFQEADIRAADQERYKVHDAHRVGIDIRPDHYAAFCEENRPLEDTQFLADQADRKARVESAMRSAARLEYSIDNLTEETIDGWSADMSEAFK